MSAHGLCSRCDEPVVVDGHFYRCRFCGFKGDTAAEIEGHSPAFRGAERHGTLVLALLSTSDMEGM